MLCRIIKLITPHSQTRRKHLEEIFGAAEGTIQGHGKAGGVGA